MDFRDYEETILPLFNKEIDGKVEGIPCSFYYALAINEEAGELGSKIKKLFRDDHGLLTTERRDAALKECGDILAYLAAISRSLDSSLDEVAKLNIHKLVDRQLRGVISGSGDNR